MFLNVLQQLNISIFYFINNGLSNPILNLILPFLTNLGNIIVLLVICGILYVACGKKGERVALIAILAIAIATLFVLLIKPTVGELRPFLVLAHVNVLVHENNIFSFPSEHTALSFAVAIVLGLNYKIKKVKLIYITLAIAVIVGFSRIYVGAHYPVDVLGGMILGVVSGLVTLKLGDYVFKKLGVYNGDY